jgi:hypothetical protein
LKLNVLKLALASAIVSGISLALLPIYGIYFGKALRAVSILGGVYPGYVVSWQGAGLGLVYGFASCFVYMGIFALVYNQLLTFKGIKLPKIKIKAKAKPVSRKKKK